MRIGLDARYLSHGLTGGVRTYVYHLVHVLPRCAPAHEFVYYIDEKTSPELGDLPDNVVVRRLPWKGIHSSLVNDVRIGRWMERDRVDVAHSPANYGPRVRMPLVLTLHDTINLFPLSQHLRGFSRNPRKLAMMLYLGTMTRATLRRASWVIAVSDHARRDIAARSGYPLSRLTTVYEAASPLYRPMEPAACAHARKRWGLEGTILLADGIKNPASVIEAFQALPSGLGRDTLLVFFSREAAPRPVVRTALADPRVRFVPRPSDADLATLMNLASVFLFPSWYEGFGLPLVEAMQCGTPVIGSSRGSIPEILGGAGIVFDLDVPGQLARALCDLLGDDGHRRRLCERALQRAARFSWERAARETLNVYEQALRPAAVGARGGGQVARDAVHEGIRG